jgi:hypothetical protein
LGIVLSASCAQVSGLDSLRSNGAATTDAGLSDRAVSAMGVETGTDSVAREGADAAGNADDANAGAGDDASDAEAQDTARPDAGGDVWDSGSGAASDGSVADRGADAMALGLTNPLSIDVRAHLDSNTVKTTATGGIVLTPVDGPGGGGRDFPTQAEVTALNGAGTGLPDNAFFLNNGTTIPNVQLAWTNSTNVNNSLVVLGNAGTSEAFAVPPAKYSQLQIYATAGNGSIPLNVTLTYASGNPLTTTSALTIPDWCAATTSLPAGVHTLARAGRVKMSVFDPLLCNIYAIDLNPDPTRALTSFAFVAQGTATVYLVFYGATAW